MFPGREEGFKQPPCDSALNPMQPVDNSRASVEEWESEGDKIPLEVCKDDKQQLMDGTEIQQTMKSVVIHGGGKPRINFGHPTTPQLISPATDPD